MAVDAAGRPVRALITDGPRSDCKEAEPLVEGLDARMLLADRAYDTDAILAMAKKAGMEAVIPPKKNRTVQREYDKEVYKKRHRIENAFLYLKQWRGIATRYAKRSDSFLAAVHIRCLALWVGIS